MNILRNDLPKDSVRNGMYYILYNLVLIIGTVLFLPVIIFKLATVSKYRAGISQKLGWVRKDVLKAIAGERPIWIHAVSVGEVMAVHPLVRELKKKYPHRKLIISTVTITGNYTARQRVPEADAVFYFPFDYPFVIRRVLSKLNPGMVLVAETELWPNFFKELRRARVPSVVINGRISPHSYKNYMKLKGFFSQVFEQVDLLCMQSDDDADRIRKIGATAERVLVTGNLKFDQKILASPPNLLAIPKGRNVITAGSTHRGEEEALLSVFSRLREKFPDLLLILAPRHPERFDEVEGLINSAGFECQRRTRLRGQVKDVLLLDTIGELRSFYAVCTIAFVGGSLVKVGGHNLLEPAAMKKPVIFSKYMFNFKEISEALISSGGGIMVKDKNELYHQLDHLLSNKDLARSLGGRAFRVIEQNSGAALKTINAIDSFITRV